MKQILVKKANLDLKEYKMRSAYESDFSTLITESCVLVDQDTGKQLVIYKKLDEEGFDSTDLALSLQSVKYQESERLGGLKTRSRIFGFAPRVPKRKDFCSATSLLEDNPSAHDLLCDYGRRVVELYQNNAPEVFDEHMKATEKVLNDYRIKETPFTSGIVNKNNPLKYHLDSGNFKSVYSCMLAVRNNCAGGHLALPEYDIGLDIANNSVTIFDGQQILHGVTPIKMLTPDAYRFTVVYYSLRKMWECLPPQQEVERVRNTKFSREVKRAREAEAFEGVR